MLVTGRHLARSWANIVFHERDERVSFGVQAPSSTDVEWQFTPDGAGGVQFNLGPSGQVNFPTNFLNRSNDRSSFDLIGSGSTTESVHIRQGHSSHPSFEEITMAPRSGRASGRWT